jgi:hypothetical protein
MTNEERDLITNFVQRVGGRPAAPATFAGSVPAVGTPSLPPVDPVADALLAELFQRYPEARYRMTQLAFIQEHALAEATNQINALQAQLRQSQAQAQPQPQPSPWGTPMAQPQPAPSRGLFGGLFGGGQQQQPQYQQPAYAPQPPQYAPGYQPGMFQSQGSGFLGSALTTAAGVAGGMLAANAISGMFSGHGMGRGMDSSQAGFAPSSSGFIEAPGQQATPWATPSAAPAVDPYDQGGEAKAYPVADNRGWDTDSGGSDWTDSE